MHSPKADSTAQPHADVLVRSESPGPAAVRSELSEPGIQFSSARGCLCDDALDKYFTPTVDAPYPKMSLVSVAKNYVSDLELTNILFGRAERPIRKVLSETLFPLHAVILSGLSDEPITNVVISLDDVCRGEDCVVPNPFSILYDPNLRSFLAIDMPPLKKLGPARVFGFDEPALCFLTPVNRADASSNKYVVRNLTFEELIEHVGDTTLQSKLGPLFWPLVERTIQSVRDSIGIPDAD